MSIMSSMLVVPWAVVTDASIGNGLIIPEAAAPLAMDAAVAGAEAWVVETGSGDKR